ncbi:GntR family transcriptional regulator [Shewanella schlegeliana]|uniref:GntR family transcriptional regulator n=1 Tax=Shewanella schlegeliana TaxID=190308 RepID=A0ABS1T0L0_9GAMM|nr:GntR family transcriptional regulator [Shewanella schlegeliana]MBL4914324.1 GntR family transcriptional regulator [Shewanella schlegeliana]MCL1109453.1 GntR family transcriptional regulator [Shewanella schlegeliana]GIU37305.1 GntR family transcriptional regulator [Shewanella schlegeliana]
MIINDVANKSEFAYDQLEKMITFRELKPGSMVSEKQLSEQLGVGRTPVREALQRLSYERMVEIHPRRGIQIPQISLESQLKILEVRRDVEALCARFAATRASESEKIRMTKLASQLEDNAAKQDDLIYAQLLKQIHILLVQVSNNEYLQLAMAPLQGLSRRFWFAYKNESSDLADAAYLHATILRKIVEGDPIAAVEASYALNDYLTNMARRTIS